MGNETSAYHDCHFQEEVQVSGQENWFINQARAKDGSPVSVFVYQNNGKQTNEFVENCVKSLKTLKHPSILKFLAYIKNSDEKWVITERVVPLESAIDKLSPMEICAGLYSVIEALSFLNEVGHISHNNICQTSIFMAQDGTWKVGGLEFMCRFQDANESFLQKSKNMRYKRSIAPEEEAGKVEKSLDYGHARDAYSFGVFAEFLLEYLSPLGDKASTFECRIREEFLSTNPKQRPKFSTLLRDPLFKDDYVAILNFLKNITVKTEVEKKLFFSTLPEKLFLLSEKTVATRLVRLLLSRFVLMEEVACDEVIPHLLTPCKERKKSFEPDELNPLLTEDSYKKYVLPEIFKIFQVRDAHIRMILLRHFADYVNLFQNSTLSILFPQLLLGLRDSNDELVAMTLRAVADLVPILGGDIVIGAQRNRIFVEGMPKFGERSADTLSGSLKRNGIQKSHSRPTKANDADREMLREKRKEEARKRNEERKKRREEKLMAQKSAELSEDKSTDSTAKEEDGYPADSILSNGSLPDKSPNLSDSTDDEVLADCQLEIRPDTPPSPISIDWSDVNSVQKASPSHMKGVLKLQKRSESVSADDNDDNASGWDNEESWNDDWETGAAAAASPQSPSRSSWNENDTNTQLDNTPMYTKPAKVPEKPPPKVKDIDMFSMDIKTSVDVKPVEEEMDFFADMQPNFKPAGDNLLSILSGDISTSKAATQTETEKKVALSFEVQDSSAIGDGGWGDDDWNVDDNDLEI